MGYTIAMLLAYGFVIAAIVLALWLVFKRGGGKGLFRPLYVLVAGVVLSAFTLYIPLYLDSGKSLIPGLLTQTLHDVIQLFTVDSNSELIAYLPEIPDTVAFFYTLLFFILYGMTPFLTFGFILSFVKNLNAHICFFFHRKSDAYIFSDLNERSLALAESIHNTLTGEDFDRVTGEYEAEKYKEITAACLREVGETPVKPTVKAASYRVLSEEEKALVKALAAFAKVTDNFRVLALQSASKEEALCLLETKEFLDGICDAALLEGKQYLARHKKELLDEWMRHFLSTSDTRATKGQLRSAIKLAFEEAVNCFKKPNDKLPKPVLWAKAGIDDTLAILHKDAARLGSGYYEACPDYIDPALGVFMQHYFAELSDSELAKLQGKRVSSLYTAKAKAVVAAVEAILEKDRLLKEPPLEEAEQEKNENKKPILLTPEEIAEYEEIKKQYAAIDGMALEKALAEDCKTFACRISRVNSEEMKPFVYPTDEKPLEGEKPAVDEAYAIFHEALHTESAVSADALKKAKEAFVRAIAFEFLQGKVVSLVESIAVEQVKLAALTKENQAVMQGAEALEEKIFHEIAASVDGEKKNREDYSEKALEIAEKTVKERSGKIRRLPKTVKLYRANRQKQAIMVFLSVKEEDEKTTNNAERARNMGAVLFSQDVLTVDLSKHKPKANLFFFMMDENESLNVDSSLGLLAKYGDRENTHFYVFSDSAESELLLTTTGARHAKVKRVNVIRSLINHNLYETGKTIFEKAVPCEPNVNEPHFGAKETKSISAVVIGMGLHGTEMVKALSWYGQMVGYRLEINAFDSDEGARSRFTAKCPDLMCTEFNGEDAKNHEDCYRINIHQADVFSQEFVEKLKTLPPITYVMVCLGQDEVNLEVAVRMRSLCASMGYNPFIQAIRYQTGENEDFSRAVNFKNQKYDIDLVGDMKSMYSEKVIFHSDMEEKALRRHMIWGNEADFWKFEYNYLSSVASALHHELKIKLGLPGANLPPAKRTEEQRDIIRRLEHRRWNAYMRSEGYTYAPVRNDMAKQHPCLVFFDDLPLKEKIKDDD